MTDNNHEAGGVAADSLASPVRRITGDTHTESDSGTALCLSGGGYRAMIFHVGVLWRLNEAGYLTQLDRVSSVSGGSITAGVLGMNWSRLGFDANGVAQNFVDHVVKPIRRLAGETIDRGAVLAGAALPFLSVSDLVAKAYRKHLYGDATLQALPDKPRIVINATNLESSSLLRFSKPYLADYRVGRIHHPEIPLAVAVAASSAFPPVLSPSTLDLSDQTWTTDPGNTLTADGFRTSIRLTDGGVYDNLGLETAWKKCRTVLVSDGGGGPLQPQENPPADWARHTLRVLFILDSQVRSLRKRQVIDAYKSGARSGVYVGIHSHLPDYPLPDSITVNRAVAERLAATPTRLAAMSKQLQEELINWGYAVCDAGIRSHMISGPAPQQLPYDDRPMAD
jgi:NTE family protein